MLIITDEKVFQNGVSFTSCGRTVETCIQNSGIIVSTLSNTSSFNGSSCISKYFLGRKTTFILTIIFMLIYLLLTWFENSDYSIFLLLFFPAILSFLTLTPAVFKFQLEEKHSTMKYHAALHVVKNAYKQLHRILTLAEVRQFSFISKQCSAYSHFEQMFFWLPLSIFSLIVNEEPLTFLIFLFLYLLWFFVPKHRLVVWVMQLFVFDKPTDKELFVAITCLNLLEQVVNEKNNFNDIIISHYPPSSFEN